jgi:hypothetical protein
MTWVTRIENDVLHEREVLREWSNHHAVAARRGQNAVGVTMAAVAGFGGGAALRALPATPLSPREVRANPSHPALRRLGQPGSSRTS